MWLGVIEHLVRFAQQRGGVLDAAIRHRGDPAAHRYGNGCSLYVQGIGIKIVAEAMDEILHLHFRNPGEDDDEFIAGIPGNSHEQERGE